jgi:translation initiation factor 2-alpha kinase 3
MFRSAADISSSDTDSDSDEGESSGQQTRNPNSGGTSGPRSNGRGEGKGNASANLSSSVDSTSEVDSSISRDDISALSQDALGVNVERHANFMTAALLEFYCQSRAADILNAQKGSSKRFTRHSPEAQYLGKKLYKYKSQFLASHGVLADGVEKEELGGTRQTYRDNLDLLGLSALEDLNLNETQPPTPIEGSEELALVSKNLWAQQGVSVADSNTHFWKVPEENATFRKDIPTASNFKVLEGIPIGTPSLPAPSRPLFGSSPVSMPLFNGPAVPPYNNMSRYSVEFAELKVLGRGSFGEVYHVTNHIDGQDYAVKKIPISQRRLDQLQYGGQNQLETIMKEIRTLARLEHTNIVRYYGAWVEQAHVSGRGHFDPQAHTRYEPPHIDIPSRESTNEPSMGIVFEHSESSAVESHASSSLPDEYGFSNRISRWDSHATSSSRRSKKSSGTALEDDDDIESIPRNFENPSYGQTSTFGETDDIFTDGLSQDQSRFRVQRQHRFGQQAPAVILHIQMSLHPISLSSYLNPQSAGKANADNGLPSRRHCFHLMPSLRLMLDIISGVEYLHTKGIVHRDLKPANIFLCAPESTTLDICATCKSDPASPTHFCRPRIGDFGLVADISHLNEPTEENAITPYHGCPKIQRVVGTEFYRPPANSSSSDASDYFDEYKIDEKLDVYALGVILFELLYRLNTKMERQTVLNDLTRRASTFPADFAAKIDHCEMQLPTGLTVAETIINCIRGMLDSQSQRRWSLQEVKEHLRPIYKCIKHL